MVFATFGFYITIWFSKPAHRKAVFRCMQLYRETPKTLRKINENASKTN